MHLCMPQPLLTVKSTISHPAGLVGMRDITWAGPPSFLRPSGVTFRGPDRGLPQVRPVSSCGSSAGHQHSPGQCRLPRPTQGAGLDAAGRAPIASRCPRELILDEEKEPIELEQRSAKAGGTLVSTTSSLRFHLSIARHPARFCGV